MFSKVISVNQDRFRCHQTLFHINSPFFYYIGGAEGHEYPDLPNNPGLCPWDFGQLDKLIGLLHHCHRPAPARSHACVALCIGEMLKGLLSANSARIISSAHQLVNCVSLIAWIFPHLLKLSPGTGARLVCGGLKLTKK